MISLWEKNKFLFNVKELHKSLYDRILVKTCDSYFEKG